MATQTIIKDPNHGDAVQIHGTDENLCPTDLMHQIMEEGAKLAEGAPPLTPEQIDTVVVALRMGQNKQGGKRRAA